MMFFSESTGGFFTTEVHGSAIPEDAVGITLGEHSALLDGQALGKVISASAHGHPFLSDPPAPTLDQLRGGKRAEIETAYLRSISVVTAGYPPDERTSWAVQEREARAWQSDQSAPTPLLSVIAGERGVPLPDLAHLVATKADQYAAIAGATFERRRMRLAAVDVAETPDAVAAITW